MKGRHAYALAGVSRNFRYVPRILTQPLSAERRSVSMRGASYFFVACVSMFLAHWCCWFGVVGMPCPLVRNANLAPEPRVPVRCSAPCKQARRHPHTA